MPDEVDISKNKLLPDYLKTKFARFILLQSISSISLSKEKFALVPVQYFHKSWTNEELYKKYDLSEDEINFIESMIKLI
jgi:site-specific DNA-methyltransferase (adenine-specific)